MFFAHKSIRCFLLFLFINILSISASFAQAGWVVKINTNNNFIRKQLESGADIALRQSYERWKNIVPLIKIDINVAHNIKPISFSTANAKECEIKINYTEELQPVLLRNFQDDLTFTIWHEIAHCMLDKEIFYKSSFDWKVNLDNFQISTLNKDIENQTTKAIASLNCLKCRNKEFKIAPPVVVYHEIFADTQASLWWKLEKKDMEDILFLYNKRQESFRRNPISTLHASNFSLLMVIDMKIKDNDDVFKISQEISQYGFIDYLNEIKYYKEIN